MSPGLKRFWVMNKKGFTKVPYGGLDGYGFNNWFVILVIIGFTSKKKNILYIYKIKLWVLRLLMLLNWLVVSFTSGVLINLTFVHFLVTCFFINQTNI